MLGKIFGSRYQITGHLGGGGFGQTYLAEDLHLPGKPTCVVKQLKPKMTDPESFQAARRLFDTEAEVLYTLGDHDQIPKLFAHFEENQDFFLVQEFIDGEVFSQELLTHQQFTEAEVVCLLQDVLTVLEFVHQQQVVHRDIKPSNLIRRGSDRRFVLIDFGAVKQIGMRDSIHEQATMTVAVGSSGYMPNEQLAGMPRFASDVYAVGVLAIQCLTGVYPKRLLEDPRTSEIRWRDRAMVSPELAEILDKMVRYDFRQRYPTAKEALAVVRSLTGIASVSVLLSEQKHVSVDGLLVWVERADELFQQQRYREAVSAYDQVIQANPNHYLAWFKRGITLENLQCYEDAAASYDRVLKLQPEDYLAWYRWGNVLEQLQQYTDALHAYEQVVQLQPDSYWAWHDRGKVLENLQRQEEAVASYDRAVQLKPDFQLAVESRKRLLSQLKQVDTLYHLQHYDEALASCDRAIQQNPDDALSWFMRGMALENLQRYDEAVMAYQRVVEIQPDDHLAWFKQATLLDLLQRAREALIAYQRVVQLKPDNFWAWHDRGKLLENLGRYEEAIACYDRAVQVKPDFQAAVKGRTRLLKQIHQSLLAPTAEQEADATDLLATGEEPQPLNTPTSNAKVTLEDYKHRLPSTWTVDSLSEDEETSVRPSTSTEKTEIFFGDREEDETIIATSTGQHSRAVKPFNRTTRFTEAGHYMKWFEQGLALEKSQQYAEALQAFDQAIQRCSNDPEVWRCRGSVLYILGHNEQAVASYKRATQLKGNSAEMWYGLGGCLIRLRRYEEAIAAFDRAIQLQPKHPIPWYWRGRALFELQQYLDALQSFEQAIALKPDFHPAIADCRRVKNRLKAVEKCNVAV